jgi:hypothetical protein
MHKRCKERSVYRLPSLGGRLNVALESLDGREAFFLDLQRGRIDLTRRTYQHRARQIIVLARVDFGAPHRNPDGEEIGVPHIHLYREGYADKWAMPLPLDRFRDAGDPQAVLADFLALCNIVEPPTLEGDLLS